MVVYFSALGRAVWDETAPYFPEGCYTTGISVLSVEPYGMKQPIPSRRVYRSNISVLSVEPYGMKPGRRPIVPAAGGNFSALGRAVWDETR